jgi:VWFA-related protein
MIAERRLPLRATSPRCRSIKADRLLQRGVKMRAKLISIVACCALSAALALVAQEIPSDELFWGSRPYSPEIVGSSAIRVQSDLVEVPTVVRDAHGNAVGNLKKEDFLLFDNGKPQTISTFSILAGAADSSAPVEATPPLYVALFFDDVNSGIANLHFARDGAIKFVRKGLDPGERVGIFTASGTVSLDFTDDVQKLLDTLAKLAVLQRMRPQGPGACPQMGAYTAWVIKHDLSGQTLEFQGAVRSARGCGCTNDADRCVRRESEMVVDTAEDRSLDTFDAIKYVIKHLGQMPGRRVLVLASSGFLTLSLNQQMQKVVEAALRANVVINSLSTVGVSFGMQRLDGSLSALASGTGGKYIHDNNDLGAGFHALSATPNVTYLLGFSPTNLKVDGLEHNLKVKLTDPTHMNVSARPGYYAPSPELSPVEKRFRKLEQSVLAAEDRAEIPVEFSATPETSASGERSLKILVHVDVRKLAFQDLGDRHSERLIFITALFDEKNQFLTGVQGVMDLRLKEATLKQIATQGLSAKMSIQAPAGSYRVRQVVEEAVDGKLAAVNRMVEIR